MSVRYNDIGTVFKCRIVSDQDGSAIDISSATTMQIVFRKAVTNERLVKTATFLTDGTDGYMKYVTVDGDLDTLGLWRMQGFVETPTNSNSSVVGTFEVGVKL